MPLNVEFEYVINFLNVMEARSLIHIKIRLLGLPKYNFFPF